MRTLVGGGLVLAMVFLAGSARADEPTVALALEADGVDASALRAGVAEDAGLPVVALGEPANVWLVVRASAEGATVMLAEAAERWEVQLPAGEGAPAAWLRPALAELLRTYVSRSTLRSWQGQPLTRRTAALLPWPAAEGDENVPDNPYAVATRTLLPWSEAAPIVRHRAELGQFLDAPRPGR